MPSIFELKFLSDVASALTGVRQMTSGLSETTEGVKRMEEQFSKAKETVFGLVETLGAYLEVEKLREYMSAASEAAKAQRLLDQALRSSGQYSAEYKSELGEQAEAISKLTGESEKSIQSVQQRLVMYGVERDKMEEFTKLVFDLSAARGMDADSAAELIGRAMMGETVMMRGVRLEIDKTLPKSEQIRQAFEKLNSMFGGAAEAAKTSGKVYSTAMEELEVSVGRVVKIPFGEFYKAAAPGIIATKNAIDQFVASNAWLPALLRSVGQELGNVSSQSAGTKFAVIGLAGAFVGLLGIINGAKYALMLLQATLTTVGVGGLLPFIRNLYLAQSAFGFFQGYVVAATGSLTAFKIALMSIGTVLAVAGAAVAGWKLGAFTRELDLGSMKVKEWGELVIAGVVLTFNQVKNFVLGIGSEISSGLTSLLNGALTSLAEFAKSSADLVNSVLPDGAKIPTGWAVKLINDSAGTQAEIDAAQAKRRAELKASTQKAVDDFNADVDDITMSAIHRHDREPGEPQQATSAPIAPASPSGGGTGSAGKGDGGASLRTKAVDEGAEAEKHYQMELDLTRGKLEIGEITQSQAEAENRSTVADYIARLRQLQATLPPTSEKFKELEVRVLAAQAVMQKSSALGQIGATFRKVVNDWGDVGKNASEWLQTSMNQGISSVSEGLTGLIMQTGNWRQTFMGAINSMLNGLIELGVKTAAHYIMMMVMGDEHAASGVANTATVATAQVAAGAAIATAHAPAAAATSLSTYGVGALVAAALAAVAIGAIIGLLVGGFAEGGLIPGSPSHTDNRVAHVAAGEYVVRTSAVQHYGVGFLHALNNMSLPMKSPAYAAGGLVGGGGAGWMGGSRSGGGATANVSVGSPNVTLIQPNTHSAMHEAMRSAQGDVIILDAVLRQRRKLPFKQ